MKTYENPEWQANTFGGELLAPSYLIKNKSIAQIQKDHGITRTAAKVQKDVCERLEKLNKGDDNSE